MVRSQGVRVSRFLISRCQDQKKDADRIMALLTELVRMRKPNLYTTHSKGYMAINK